MSGARAVRVLKYSTLLALAIVGCAPNILNAGYGANLLPIRFMTATHADVTPGALKLDDEEINQNRGVEAEAGRGALKADGALLVLQRKEQSAALKYAVQARFSTRVPAPNISESHSETPEH